MSLPFGRGGRGLAMQRAAQKDEENPPRAPLGFPIGRGLPGRGLGIAQKGESSEKPESGRGRGIGIQPRTDSTEIKAPSIGRGLPFGRGSIGRGLNAPSLASSQAPDLPERMKAVALTDRRDTERTVETPRERAAARGDEPGEGRRGRHLLKPVGPEIPHGDLGSRMDMTANYIRVRCNQEEIYQYAVDFKPAIDARMLRQKIISRLPAEQFGGFPSEARAFDGRILYLPGPLPREEIVIKTTRPNDSSQLLIKIVLTNRTPIVSCPSVYNTIFRKVQRTLKMTQVGRHYYDPEKKITIGQHNLEIWPGYITTIAAYEAGLLLMCDVSHKVIRKDTVHDVIKSVISCSQSDANFQQQCIQQIVGQSVLTRYRNSTYRIDDIDFKRHAKSTFLQNGTEITFASYYKEQYNISIQDPSQPLLLTRRKKFGPPESEGGGDQQMIALIPELCFITGLTDSMRENFRLMKAIHEHTRVTPQVRHQAMRKFLSTVASCEEASRILRTWGMYLESDTVKIGARIMPPEKVKFGGNEIINLERNPDANFKRELGRQKVLSDMPLDSWLLICTSRDQEIVKEFLRTLQQRARSAGIQVSNPKIETLRDDRTDSYLKAIKNNLSSETRMVLAVFPTKRGDRYNAFKKMCCVECPVPSQVVLTNTIRNPSKLSSVATNVVLQMNVKMGGELWAVRVPIKKFMVVGIDAYHHGKQRSNSVFGMCASSNASCTRYYSRAIFQEREGQELGDKIQNVMSDMLRHYYDKNNFLPDTIFFYRDGVGDSMLSTVQSHEIPQIIRGFSTFGEGYKPRVVFNVVQKRINTRIFAPTSREMTNPKPGTIVDHTITRRDRYDFFLVPQSVNQGTVTPTHLVVLHDSSGMLPNEVQQMAYKQCHLYYNWPGTIRVPACCLYAHKLAYLIGQNIQKEPSQRLTDRLFFI